jgi:membrane-associated phospholipid phosphatase
MPVQTAVAQREEPRPRRRRPPFFRTHWNETYGWHVAAIIGAVIGCAVAFAAIAEAVSAGDVITTWDARLNRWFHVHATQPLTRGVELFTHLGSGVWLISLAAVAVGILGARRAWADALLVALATAGALIINPLFKEFFSRPRPTIHDPDLTLRTFSFPSGHSMGSAAVYGALAIVIVRRVRGTVWAPVVVASTVLLVLLIGASRVYLGAHFPTDVVAGWILGIAWLLVCVLALTIYERARKTTS